MKVSGRSHPAVVSAVLPELDAATRTRTVVLQLAESATGQVVPAQVARMEVVEATEIPGYWLPTNALTQGTRGLWSVYAVQRDEEQEGDKLDRRYVEVIHSESDRTFVRGTLQPGDRIVTSGSHRLVPGQPVTVASAARAADSNNRP